MKLKQLPAILTFFIIALLTLATSVFAWVTLSRVTEIGGIDSNIPDFTKLIDFYVKRTNDLDYKKISSITDMEETFGNTKPKEEYTFKVVIDNKTSKNISIIARLSNVRTLKKEGYEDFDLLDVFYIKDGLVDVNYGNIQQRSIVINPNSTEIVTKHDQTLNMYRLSNIINKSGDVLLFPTENVSVNEKITFTFTLVYDSNTRNNKYQENNLEIDGIYIYRQ